MDGRRLTIDEILVDYVGQFGWKQQQIFFLTSLIWLPAAFVTLCMSFAGALPTGQPLPCEERPDVITTATQSTQPRACWWSS